jgi:hypothetical protein
MDDGLLDDTGARRREEGRRRIRSTTTRSVEGIWSRMGIFATSRAH